MADLLLTRRLLVTGLLLLRFPLAVWATGPVGQEVRPEAGQTPSGKSTGSRVATSRPGLDPISANRQLAPALKTTPDALKERLLARIKSSRMKAVRI